VFQGAGRQFVYDKPNANGLAGIDDHVFSVHWDGNRFYVSQCLAQPPANIPKIFLHADYLIAARKLELILTLCHDVQPCRSGGLKARRQRNPQCKQSNSEIKLPV
jgi:hypothetical protein